MQIKPTMGYHFLLFRWQQLYSLITSIDKAGVEDTRTGKMVRT